MHRLCFLAFVACGASPPPPAARTAPPPPDAEPAPPACIAPLEEATVPIRHAAVDGTRIKYCVGDNPDQCFALDTASGAFEKLGKPPTSNDLANARIETTLPDVKVCQMDACRSLTPKVLPAAANMKAATNSNGSIAVFLLGDAQAGRGFGEVWDVTAMKKLGTFRYARGEFKCGDVSIIDDTILVTANMCNAPAARGTLFTTKGRRIASVGGPDYGVYGNAHAAVDIKQWAFLEENGSKIVVQDLVRGRILKKIDTSILFKEAGGGAPMGNPGESALLRLAPGKLAIVGGAPATGHVAVVDVVTSEVKVLQATVCEGAPSRI